MRTVGVKLTLDWSQYVSGLKSATTATKEFAGSMDKAAKAGKLDKVADQAAHFGLVGAAAFGLVVKSAADFDKQMSAVSAATHASSKDLDSLRAAALQAGKDTQYSATQAAQGITELSKAGISTANILGGGLKGALSLAAAGQLEVGDAAEIAASALTQFKLSGKDVPHVADLLAAAAGKAQGTVHDMGEALNQSGLVAAQFGLSIEDTTGVLAEFASAGLTGSDAGTSLKTMLLNLATPTTQTRNLMADLGISFYDATGKFIGFNGVAQVLQTRLKGLTDAQKQQALGQIFGNDAIRSASILYTDGAAGVDKWKNSVNDAGYASETAAKLTNNLAGDFERLKGSVETLAISSGSGANSGLRVLTKGLNAVVNQFLSLPPAVGSTVTVLAGLGGASLLGLAGFVKVRKGIADAVEQLTAMGPAGEKAAAGLGKASKAAGIAAAAFVGLEVFKAVFEYFGPAAVDVDKLTEAVQNFATTGQVAGALAQTFGADMGNFRAEAKTAADGMQGFNKAVNDLGNTVGAGAVGDWLADLIGKPSLSVNIATENMKAYDTALSGAMDTLGDAKKASDLWNRALSESGMNTEDLAKLLPNAYAEVGKLNKAADAASVSQGKMGGAALGTSKKMGDVTSALDIGAAAQDKYATVADAAAGASRGEAAALTALAVKLKAQTDPAFALLDAQQTLTDAQKDYNDALKKHGPKSAEAREAMRKLALAAIGLEGAAGTASQTLDGKMSPALRDTLKAAGFTKTEIDQLAGQFKDAKKAGDNFAKKYPASVSVSGLPKVVSALQYLGQLQDALKAGKPPPGGWSASTGSVLKGLNDPKLRAAGGPIEGPGGPKDDLIPAMLSNGEHVWTAAEVQAVGGQGAMMKLRQAVASGKRVEYNDATPGFAGGGAVGYPYPVSVAKTKIPSKASVMAAVTPAMPGGGGGPGWKWMVAAAHAAFPGLGVISTYRPGAVTLTGNRSYHAVGRAVDFSPSQPFAEWVNAKYMRQTKELITPWQSLNIHNGARHHYSPLIENQHSAHDHWAMYNGGIINEPIFGVGASGDTYSFGEHGRRERVTPMTGGGDGGGVTTINHISLSAPIAINGSNLNPQQIASQVNRQLGALVDQYARGI